MESRKLDELAALVIDAAFHLHRDVGPGMLETVYEALMAKVLFDRGIAVRRQVPVPIEYAGVILGEGFRVDLLVEEHLMVELKSVEKLAPVHYKQVVTYLRMMRLPLGLLINFGSSLFKDGIKRIANCRFDYPGPILIGMRQNADAEKP